MSKQDFFFKFKGNMINSMNKIRKGHILNHFLINKHSYCEIFVYGLTELGNKAKKSCRDIARNLLPWHQ